MPTESQLQRAFLSGVRSIVDASRYGQLRDAIAARGILYDGFISATDTATVRCINYSTGTIDPKSASIRVAVIAVA